MRSTFWNWKMVMQKFCYAQITREGFSQAPHRVIAARVMAGSITRCFRQAKKSNNSIPLVAKKDFGWVRKGGQYSIYFKKGDPFDYPHWQVPAIIDTIAYDIVEHNNTSATFSKKASVTNYSGTTFDLEITRKIQLLDKDAIQQKLQTTIPDDVRYVAMNLRVK
jgi:hypothetical protein